LWLMHRTQFCRRVSDCSFAFGPSCSSVETLRIRLRQFTTIVWRSSKKWHTQFGKEAMVIQWFGKRKAHSNWYRGYNPVAERALKNLSISIFIKALPTSVQRSWQHSILWWWILVEDADAKEDNTFSDLSLAMPRNKTWMINRETFSTPLLMFSLML
jgi:hypothetical protein